MRNTRTLFVLFAAVLPLDGAVASRATAAAAESRPVVVLESTAPRVRGGEGREGAVAGSLTGPLKQVVSRERGPLWFAWDVAATPSFGDACCLDDKFHGCVCRLEAKNQTWGSQDDRRGSGRELGLARWSGGQVERVRAFSTTCEFDTGGLLLVHLTSVAPADSVALLEGLARRP